MRDCLLGPPPLKAPCCGPALAVGGRHEAAGKRLHARIAAPSRPGGYAGYEQGCAERWAIAGRSSARQQLAMPGARAQWRHAVWRTIWLATGRCEHSCGGLGSWELAGRRTVQTLGHKRRAGEDDVWPGVAAMVTPPHLAATATMRSQPSPPKGSADSVLGT
jgi:hypothetical protein